MPKKIKKRRDLEKRKTRTIREEEEEEEEEEEREMAGRGKKMRRGQPPSTKLVNMKENGS